MKWPGQQFFRELLCASVIVEAEDKRNVATVEGIYFFFSWPVWTNLCSRSLLVCHSDSATVTAAILLSDVGTSHRSDKSETHVINRCYVRNLPQIHSGVIAVVCCDSWHYCWCWWWFGDIKQTMIVVVSLRVGSNNVIQKKRQCGSSMGVWQLQENMTNIGGRKWGMG